MTPSSKNGSRGFTLIELMIVVAIIGVLATVAAVSYRKYLDAARTTEAYGMLGEIRNREEAYRAEFSSYISSGATGNQSESSLFPAVDSGTCYGGSGSYSGKEPCPKAANAQTGATIPAGWGLLGINAGRNTLQCGYTAIANTANTAVSGTLGIGFLGTANQTTTWWYAIAVCDNDGNTTTNATFVTAFNTTVVSAQNEHK
jgi:prepilin-type N-terminal cleavage/methylation domain-containing protein